MAISSSKVVVLVTVNYPLIKMYVGELPLACTPEHSELFIHSFPYLGEISLVLNPEGLVPWYYNGEVPLNLTPEHSECYTQIFISNEIPLGCNPEYISTRTWSWPSSDIGISFDLLSDYSSSQASYNVFPYMGLEVPELQLIAYTGFSLSWSTGDIVISFSLEDYNLVFNLSHIGLIDITPILEFYYSKSIIAQTFEIEFSATPESAYNQTRYEFVGDLSFSLLNYTDWEDAAIYGTFNGCGSFCSRKQFKLSKTNTYLADAWWGQTEIPDGVEFHRMRKKIVAEGRTAIYDKVTCPTIDWTDSAYDMAWNYDDSKVLWLSSVGDGGSGMGSLGSNWGHFYVHDGSGNFSSDGVDLPGLSNGRYYQAVAWNPVNKDLFALVVGATNDSPGGKIFVYRRDTSSITLICTYSFNHGAYFFDEVFWDHTGRFITVSLEGWGNSAIHQTAEFYILKFDSGDNTLTKTYQHSREAFSIRFSPYFSNHFLTAEPGGLVCVYSFDKINGTISLISSWSSGSQYVYSAEWLTLSGDRIIAYLYNPNNIVELEFNKDAILDAGEQYLTNVRNFPCGSASIIRRSDNCEMMAFESGIVSQCFTRFIPSSNVTGSLVLSTNNEFLYCRTFCWTPPEWLPDSWSLNLNLNSLYSKSFNYDSEFEQSIHMESEVYAIVSYVQDFTVSFDFISLYGLSTSIQSLYFWIGFIDTGLTLESLIDAELQIGFDLDLESICYRVFSPYLGDFLSGFNLESGYLVFNNTEFSVSLSFQSTFYLTRREYLGDMVFSMKLNVDWEQCWSDYRFTTTSTIYGGHLSADGRYAIVVDSERVGSVSIGSRLNSVEGRTSKYYQRAGGYSVGGGAAGMHQFGTYALVGYGDQTGASLSHNVDDDFTYEWIDVPRTNYEYFSDFDWCYPLRNFVVVQLNAAWGATAKIRIYRRDISSYVQRAVTAFGVNANLFGVQWDCTGQFVTVSNYNNCYIFQFDDNAGSLTQRTDINVGVNAVKGLRFSPRFSNYWYTISTTVLNIYAFNKANGSVSFLASYTLPSNHSFNTNASDWIAITEDRIAAIVTTPSGEKPWIFYFNKDTNTVIYEREFPTLLTGFIRSSYNCDYIIGRHGYNGDDSDSSLWHQPGIKQSFAKFIPTQNVGNLEVSPVLESLYTSTVTNSWLGLFETDLTLEGIYNLCYTFTGDLSVGINLESVICRTQVFPTTWLFTSFNPQSLYKLTKYEYEGDININLTPEGESTGSFTFIFVSTLQLTSNLESINVFNLCYLSLINLVCNPESIYLKYEPVSFYEGLIQFSITPNTISVIGTDQDFHGMDLRSAWGNKVSETTQADFETGSLSGLEIVNNSLSLIWIEEIFQTNQSLDIIGGSLVVGYDLYFNIEAKELPEAPERLIKVKRLWSTFQPNKTGVTKIYWRRGPYDPDAVDWTLAGTVEMSSGNTLSETEIPIDIDIEIAQGETLGIWIETEDPYAEGWEIAYSEGANVVKENDYINITTGRACLDPDQCGDWYYFEPASFTGIVKYDILKQEFLPFEGYRISPIYDLSSVGRYSSSRVVWDAVVPSDTELKVDVKISEDGGIEWSDWINVSNKDSLPVFNEWSKLNNIRLQYRVSLSTFDVIKSPTFNEITFAVYSYMPVPVVEPNIEILEAMSNQFDQGYLYNLVVESEGLLALDSANGIFVDSGYRVSPTYVFLKPQKVDDSIVYWVASNPAGCSFKIESRVSVDGEFWSSWEELENGSAIPNLPVNTFLQHAKIQFRQLFDSAVQPFWDATPFLDGLYVGLYTLDVPYSEIKEISEESFNQGELINTEVVDNCLVLLQDNITDGPFNLNLKGSFRHYAYNGSIIQLIPDADVTIQGIWLQFIEAGDTHVKVYYRENDGVICDDGKWNLVISRKFNVSLEKTLTHVPSDINLVLNKDKEYLIYITTTGTNIKCHQHSVTDYHNEPGLKVGSVQAFNYKFKDRLDGYCFTGVISYTRNRDVYANSGYRISPVYSFGVLGQIPIDTVIEWSANIPEDSLLSIQTRISTDSGVTWLSWVDVNNGDDIPHFSSALRIGSIRLQIKEIMNSNEIVSPKLEWLRVRAYLYDGSSVTEDVVVEDLTHDFEVGCLEDTLAQNDSLELSTSPGVGYRPNLIYTDFRDFEVGSPVVCTSRFNTGVNDPVWTIVEDSEYTGGKYLTRE